MIPKEQIPGRVLPMARDEEGLPPSYLSYYFMQSMYSFEKSTSCQSFQDQLTCNPRRKGRAHLAGAGRQKVYTQYIRGGRSGGHWPGLQDPDGIQPWSQLHQVFALSFKAHQNLYWTVKQEPMLAFPQAGLERGRVRRKGCGTASELRTERGGRNVSAFTDGCLIEGSSGKVLDDCLVGEDGVVCT
jgi:hypothetical protein